MKKIKVAVILLLILFTLGAAVFAGESDEPDEPDELSAVEVSMSDEVKEAEKEEIAKDLQDEVTYEGQTVGEGKKAPQNEEKAEKTHQIPTAREEVVEEAPKHTHSWEALYAESVVYEPVDVYGIRCNYCGYSTTSAKDLYEHIDLDPFDNCGSYSTGVVIRTEERPIIKSYVSGYKCSCGAEK